MDAEKVEKVCKKLEDKIEIAYRNADLDLPSNQMHVVYPIRVDTCDAKTILSVIRELKAENERLKQEKADVLKRVQALDIPCVGIRSYKAYMQGCSDAITEVINIINRP